MPDLIFIHHTDKMTAAVIPHQIQRRQIHFYVQQARHQFPVFLQESADTSELHICNLFNHMILFCNLNKHIRCNPAQFRMIQAAQRLHGNKSSFPGRIYRLIVYFKEIFLNCFVKILFHPFVIHKTIHCLAVILYHFCQAVLRCQRLQIFRIFHDQTAFSKLLSIDNAAYNYRNSDIFIFHIQHLIYIKQPLQFGKIIFIFFQRRRQHKKALSGNTGHLLTTERSKLSGYLLQNRISPLYPCYPVNMLQLIQIHCNNMKRFS